MTFKYMITSVILDPKLRVTMYRGSVLRVVSHLCGIMDIAQYHVNMSIQPKI